MSIYIVVTIIVLLSALACYAFISQSIEKKRVQKQRMLMTLKTKHRNLLHMVNGFPQNFLNSELLGLVYRAIIETCEQLSELEPENPRHQDEITLINNQLSALSKNNPSQRARVDNPQQMKEVRQHLQELQHFVIQQQTLKNINKVQAAAFQDQIQRLALQMAVDGNIFQAKQAQQSGKARLAIHYYTLAKKLLATENSTHVFDKQIAQLDSIILKLEEKALISDQAPTQSAAPTSSKEWDAFDKQKAAEDELWKKKQIYD